MFGGGRGGGLGSLNAVVSGGVLSRDEGAIETGVTGLRGVFMGLLSVFRLREHY